MAPPRCAEVDAGLKAIAASERGPAAEAGGPMVRGMGRRARELAKSAAAEADVNSGGRGSEGGDRAKAAAHLERMEIGRRRGGEATEAAEAAEAERGAHARRGARAALGADRRERQTRARPGGATAHQSGGRRRLLGQSSMPKRSSSAQAAD